MKPGQCLRHVAACLSAACLLASPPSPAVNFGDEDAGWQPQHLAPSEPWEESRVELPAYPQRGDLLDVNINTAGQPYKVLIDPGSLSKDADGVVRYTVVLISTANVWNVSYEGLHCGNRRFRRYAYGIDGEWHTVGDPDWLPVAGLGINRYRNIFYDYFMCDPSGRITDAEQILRNIRAPSGGIRE